MFDDLWICNNCGCVFENEEVLKTDTLVGECHGEPAYGFEPRCPHCGSTDFDEAAHCDICDKAVSMDDLKGGACPECWKKIKEKYEHSAEKMAELFKEDEVEIKLNPFIVWALYGDKDFIEEVLLDHLKSKERDAARFGESISYADFLEDDEENTVLKVGDIE